MKSHIPRPALAGRPDGERNAMSRNLSLRPLVLFLTLAATLGLAAALWADETPVAAPVPEAAPVAPAEGSTAPPDNAKPDVAKPDVAKSAANAAAEGVMAEDMKPRKAIVLSMQEAIRLTLENSMKVKINRVGPEVALADIEKAEAKFDWSFVNTWSASRSVVASGSADNLTRSVTESESIQTGLKKTLAGGGRIEPTLKWQRNKSTDGSDESANTSGQEVRAFVTITQPLMRNAGTEVNAADIDLARNNADIARFQFKDSVLTVLSTMQQTYWDLVFAIEDLDVKRKSLRLTRDTLDQTKAQVDAGLLAPIEIARVRADLAAKEIDIITAQRVLEEKEDLLRQFINKSSSRLLDDIGVIPLERAAYTPVKLDLETEALTALESRPDYKVFQANVRSRDIELVVAKNQKLPVVDLAATLGLNGLGHNTIESLGTFRMLNYGDLQASLSVEVPIGNRAAKAGYLSARLNKVKALLDLKNAQDDIIIAVKRDVRNVFTSLRQIRSTRVARELAEERLRAEEEKFNVGTALILDVLNAQTLLSQAESAERAAIVDYNQSRIQLERDKGTLLERDRIFLNTELGPQYRGR